MPRIIVSTGAAVIRELQLTKERTTLGRRPHNDIVIDHLAISGAHAVLHMTDGRAVEIEDLDSTNGTYVNSRPVKRQALHDGDLVELGKYKIHFLQEAQASLAAPAPAPTSATPARATPAPASAVIRILSGSAAGRELPLNKIVTTVGRPGLAVAAITRRQHGYVLAHVEGGADMLRLNGATVGPAPVPIKPGDRLTLAGTEMQFGLLA